MYEDINLRVIQFYILIASPDAFLNKYSYKITVTSIINIQYEVCNPTALANGFKYLSIITLNI